MKIFLSWSGEPSRSVAKVLSTWLPQVIDGLEPYMSEEHTGKGSRWGDTVAEELAASSFGIVCLTANNLLSPWLLFEAGALSTGLAKGRVSPLLFGLEHDDLPETPLQHFQATAASKSDLYRLLRDINAARAKPVGAPILEEAFDTQWPALASKLRTIRRKYRPTSVSLPYPEPLSERNRLLAVRDELQHGVLTALWELSEAAFDGHLPPNEVWKRMSAEQLQFAYEQYINGFVMAGRRLILAHSVVYTLIAETAHQRDRVEAWITEWDELADRVAREIPYEPRDQ